MAAVEAPFSTVTVTSWLSSPPQPPISDAA